MSHCFLSGCTSPTVLQERLDREAHGVEAAASSSGANGVSDVTGSEEEAAEGAANKLEQVIDSSARLHVEISILSTKIEKKMSRQYSQQLNLLSPSQTKPLQEQTSKQLHGESAELPSNAR